MSIAKVSISSIGTGYGRCDADGNLEIARYYLGDFIWEKTNAKLNHAGAVFVSHGRELFNMPAFLRFARDISGSSYDVEADYPNKLKFTIITTGQSSSVDISRSCVISIGADGLPFNLVDRE
jgi:hypothetical protein